MKETFPDRCFNHEGSDVIKPLCNLKVTEKFGSTSTDLSRSAVSFAGLLAAEFGAQVVRVEPSGGDPMRTWPPYAGTRSALFFFLTRIKKIVYQAPASADGFLLTDDRQVFAKWPSSRKVLIKPGCEGADSNGFSELTVQARSGLLDIFGGADGRPQPLPGHQIAYASGMAAFSALLAAYFGERRGHDIEPVELSILDVALWVNWKHCLAANNGEKSTGLARVEEWTTLRCKDGFIALTFQDRDMGSLAKLTGNEFFSRPQFRSRALRRQNVRAINGAIESWAESRTRDEIVRNAQALRIPVGPVLAIDELVQDTQLRFREFFLLCSGGMILPRLPLLWNGEQVTGAGAKDELSRQVGGKGLS